MSHYCEKCQKVLDDKEFYRSKNLEKYPQEGKLNQCKKCLTMHVDNWDKETYLWILQEVDVPYIEEEWNSLLEKYGQDASKITGTTILGRYLSKMKLNQWRKYGWADTEKLFENAQVRKVATMRAQGYSGEEIEEALRKSSSPPPPPKPKELAETPSYEDPETSIDDFSDQLTEEDRLMLRLKWGRGYRPEEWVRMEQLYNDMMNSYDIQGAGHKDTLIMICKTSLKANQLIDAGDIEGF